MNSTLSKTIKLIQAYSSSHSNAFVFSYIASAPLLTLAEALVIYASAQIFTSTVGAQGQLLLGSIYLSRQSTLLAVIAICIIWSGLQVIKYFANKYLFAYTNEVSQRVSEHLFVKAYTDNLFAHGVESSAITNEYSLLSIVQSGLLIPFFQMVAGTISMLILLGITLFTTGLLGPLMLCLISCPYFISFLYSKRQVKRISSLLNELSYSLNQRLTELTSLSREVFIYDIFNSYVKGLVAESMLFRRYSSDATIIQMTPKYFLDTFSLLAVLVAILVGFVYPTGTNSQMGLSLVFSIGLLQRTQPYLSLVAGNYNLVKSNSHVLDLAFKLITSFPEINSLGGLFNTKSYMNWSVNRVLPAFSFKYVDDHRPLFLTEDCIRFPHNGLVIIKGASGSGKSTLLKILMGLLPVHLADISGSNKSSQYTYLDHPNTTSRAYVPQETRLIKGTILENVCFPLHGQYPDSASAEAALDKSGIKLSTEAYLALDTKVANEQNTLSPGQVQRIGLARAIYSNPSVLFLDEPTSSLDPLAERHFFNSLSELSNDILIICVSHSETIDAIGTHRITISNSEPKIVLERLR